jgi:hypothetical protein
MRSRFSPLATAVALALGSSVAGAAGIDDMFTIRGYGTLGGVYSTQDQGDYVHDMYAQNEGVGASETVSAAIDSRTALQLDMQFTDRFSAVIQVVSEGAYNNSLDDEPNDLWVPSLEWANLSYRVTDNITVRGGRIVSPLLMIGEYQKVGYANHWMRTPAEVYGKLPYTSVDGGDLSIKHSLFGGRNTIRGFAGSNEVRRDVNRDGRLPSADADLYGIVDTFEIGSFTLRAAYANMKAESTTSTAARAAQLGGLVNAFRATPGGAAAADTLALLAEASVPGYKSESKYYALGASYDVGNWFVMGEALKVEGATISISHKGGYVSGGVRTGKWTPYATYSLTNAEPFKGFIPTAGLPMTSPIPNFYPLPTAMGVNSSVAYAADYAQDQSTASVGVRWDVMSHFAVKAQYDHIMLPDDSTGMFINRTADFEPGKAVGLFGLSVDFVF